MVMKLSIGSTKQLPISKEELEERVEMAHETYPTIPLWTLRCIMEHGWQFKNSCCGHFAHALITNNFVETVTRADGASLKSLNSLALVLYNRIPADSWGSKEKVEKWLTTKKEAYFAQITPSENGKQKTTGK